jgi:hypothetical protein
MNPMLLSLLQATADQPIKSHHSNTVWLWVVIGFIVLAVALGTTRRGPGRRRF